MSRWFVGMAILASVFVLLGVAACFLFLGTGEQGWDYYPGLSVDEVAESSPEAIGGQLTHLWLGHFLSPRVDRNVRLEDYEIHRVEWVGEREGGFVLAVSFSVKPVAHYSDWIAGNGIAGSGGWIRHKFLFVTVVREADVYRLAEMGSGP